MSLESRQEIPEAEALIRESIRSYPEEARYHYGLGEVLAKQTKWTDAEAAYRQAVGLKPDEGRYRGLASGLLKQGRRAEALKEAQEAKRLNPYLRFDDDEVEKELGVSLVSPGSPASR